MRRFLFLVLLLAPAVAGLPAHADGDRRELDELAAARKRGEILALSEILDRVSETTGDRIIEVEFEKDEGRVLYEIYYLDSEGRRREITVDARDGRVIESAGDD
ncbi:MAG: PepSY domain-containing protein [Oricola sp.]